MAVLGKKYDQYLDFGQQDAHEFLRILLDAMRMEEFDVCIDAFPYSQRSCLVCRSSRNDNLLLLLRIRLLRRKVDE